MKKTTRRSDIERVRPESPEQRAPMLSRMRLAKMAQSAHAYVRGSTERFYEWLGSTQGKALPEGPAVWICGDCHVGNLGPLACADERVAVQVRDLDQTVVGNPVHDVIRLSLSLATAARGCDLPGVITSQMVEEVMRGYTSALEGTLDEQPEADFIRRAAKRAERRTFRDLVDERLGAKARGALVGKRFWPLTDEEREAIERFCATEPVRRLVTTLRSRPDDAPVELLDAAYWVKGCSSLGGFRAAMLLRVGGEGDKHKRSSLCLLDMKHAREPLAPRAEGVEMPAHQGQRVVKGARELAPFLGRRMLPGTLLDKPVFVRELLPQDLKLDLPQLTPIEACAIARHLAGVVGSAHARQLDEPTRAAWVSELKSGYSRSLEAPTWLWRSVVELVAIHEGAYLEHCRRYALEHS